MGLGIGKKLGNKLGNKLLKSGLKATGLKPALKATGLDQVAKLAKPALNAVKPALETVAPYAPIAGYALGGVGGAIAGDILAKSMGAQQPKPDAQQSLNFIG